MRSSDFMKAIPDVTRAYLAPPLRDFHWQARPWLVQIHYGQPALHYEVWSLRRRNLLEIGLHFEHRDRSVNDRLLDYFDTRAVAIKAELGEPMEVERWDKGWAKVYETLPLESFEAPYLERIGMRLARVVTYLQPILVAARAGGRGLT